MYRIIYTHKKTGIYPTLVKQPGGWVQVILILPSGKRRRQVIADLRKHPLLTPILFVGLLTYIDWIYTPVTEPLTIGRYLQKGTHAPKHTSFFWGHDDWF